MRELTIRATIPLPADPFEAANVIIAAQPVISGLHVALQNIEGATVSHTFDGRSARKDTVPKAKRKMRAAMPQPIGVANPGGANGEAAEQARNDLLNRQDPTA